MYSIAPSLANNYSTNYDLNLLVKSIDTKILQIATTHLNNVRFGFTNTVNLDLYDDLTIYRRILMDILLGCNCLQDILLLKVVSKLKKLTK